MSQCEKEYLEVVGMGGALREFIGSSLKQRPTNLYEHMITWAHERLRNRTAKGTDRGSASDSSRLVFPIQRRFRKYKELRQICYP